MNRYLVVRLSDGLVTNAIVWDGVSPYNEDGCQLVSLPDQPGVWIGWRHIDGQWQAPEEPDAS